MRNLFSDTVHIHSDKMSHTQVLPLPALPSGWSAEKDFKAISRLSAPTQRSIGTSNLLEINYPSRRPFASWRTTPY